MVDHTKGFQMTNKTEVSGKVSAKEISALTNRDAKTVRRVVRSMCADRGIETPGSGGRYEFDTSGEFYAELIERLSRHHNRPTVTI